jgi:hypothetical protein
MRLNVFKRKPFIGGKGKSDRTNNTRTAMSSLVLNFQTTDAVFSHPDAPVSGSISD